MRRSALVRKILAEAPASVPDLLGEIPVSEKEIRHSVELLMRIGHIHVVGKSGYKLYGLTPRGVGYMKRHPKGARLN